MRQIVPRRCSDGMGQHGRTQAFPVHAAKGSLVVLKWNSVSRPGWTGRPSGIDGSRGYTCRPIAAGPANHGTHRTRIPMDCMSTGSAPLDHRTPRHKPDAGIREPMMFPVPAFACRKRVPSGAILSPEEHPGPACITPFSLRGREMDPKSWALA